MSSRSSALDDAGERHEVLRTVFERVDGTAVQRIASQARASFALRGSDLSWIGSRGA